MAALCPGPALAWPPRIIVVVFVLSALCVVTHAASVCDAMMQTIVSSDHSVVMLGQTDRRHLLPPTLTSFSLSQTRYTSDVWWETGWRQHIVCHANYLYTGLGDILSASSFYNLKIVKHKGRVSSCVLCLGKFEASLSKLELAKFGVWCISCISLVSFKMLLYAVASNTVVLCTNTCWAELH